jgi:hypothetical protein
VAASGAVSCALVVVLAHQAPTVAFPAPALLPPLTLTGLATAIVALVPLLVVPDPVRDPVPTVLAPAPRPREEVAGRDQVA